MPEVYYIRIKKSYTSADIKDLQKLETVELLEEPPISEWQKKEVHKRLKDLIKDPSLVIPWNEAMKKIKQM